MRPGTTDFESLIAESLTETDIIFLNISMGYEHNDLTNAPNFLRGNLMEPNGESGVHTRLEEIVREHYSVGQDSGLTRARHGDCVRRAQEAILRAQSHLGIAPELTGDDLRAALRALSELAGESDIEAVFDRIFSRFCVGK